MSDGTTALGFISQKISVLNTWVCACIYTCTAKFIKQVILNQISERNIEKVEQKKK